MALNQLSDFLFNPDFEKLSKSPNLNIAIPIIIVYLAFVLWIGPAYMKSRKAYTLRNILIFYNFLQAILSGYVCYEFISFVTTYWHTRCMMKNHPNFKYLLQTAMLPGWHYYLLKFVDLLDTVFFVLRKKQNQITALHLIHHSGLCILLNWGLRYPHKASAYYLAFAFMNNSAVHVIMYTYYGLTAFGPSMQKYLWWKRYLTQIQIIQLLIIGSYMAIAFLTGCEAFTKFEQASFAFVVINDCHGCSDVLQSGRPIFDDFFQYLWLYIGNNTANVVFQMVKRLWLIRIDQ
ncbi:elongation of very long chain fatty acids protein 7 [Trichonephila clavipes]|nr:elongation of very long chain fatty acids protein 7 [Trichonephila clavipes]